MCRNVPSPKHYKPVASNPKLWCNRWQTLSGHCPSFKGNSVFIFWPNWYCTCKWTLFHAHHCLQKYDQSNYCLDDGGQVLCSFLCLEEGYELWMCLTLLILFERSLDFTIYIAYIIWGIIVGALLLAVLYPAFIFHPLYSDISMEKERGVCSM